MSNQSIPAIILFVTAAAFTVLLWIVGIALAAETDASAVGVLVLAFISTFITVFLGFLVKAVQDER